MKWATRARSKVDRVARPWLIRRFVDPQAEFLYVPADQVTVVAARVGATSRIIRGADTAAKDLTPESRGLEAVAEGFRLVYQDDHELLEREMPVYDALYAYCRQQAEKER